MMQFSWVDLQQTTFSAPQELSANSDRFRNKLAQRIAVDHGGAIAGDGAPSGT